MSFQRQFQLTRKEILRNTYDRCSIFLLSEGMIYFLYHFIISRFGCSCVLFEWLCFLDHEGLFDVFLHISLVWCVELEDMPLPVFFFLVFQ